jgi:hypothetical protein
LNAFATGGLTNNLTLQNFNTMPFSEAAAFTNEAGGA